MKRGTVNTYRQDKYYPRVVRAVAKILSRSDVVAPVEILMEMGNLTQKNHEAWYCGHVPYLERVFEGSLSKASRILRIISFHVHDLNIWSQDERFTISGVKAKTESYGSRSREMSALRMHIPRTTFGIGPRRRSGKSLNGQCPNKAMKSDREKPRSFLTWPLPAPHRCRWAT